MTDRKQSDRKASDPRQSERKRSSRALVKSLQRKQKKHEDLRDKVEKTTARLERRRLELQKLETRIADLERRVAEPRKKQEGEPSSGDARLKRARLIFNPSSGAGNGDSAERLGRIVNSLRAHGIEARIGLRTSGKEARALAKKAARAGAELVIVAAGDGTIEAVASQLIGTKTVLGIVPMGTMNNVARSLGIPLEVDEACALIGMGTTRHIDVGRVLSSEKTEVEHFLEGAGVGLSAIAMLAGKAFEKRRWNLFPWVAQKILTAQPGTIQVQMDDTVVEVKSHIVTVSNAPLMARNVLVAPLAKMDDGWLDVTVYDGMGEVELVSHFMAASGGKTDELKTYRARKVRITAEKAVLTSSDKDVTPARHVIDIEIVPRALSVIVGNGIGLTVGVESAPAAPPLSGGKSDVDEPSDADRLEPKAAAK